MGGSPDYHVDAQAGIDPMISEQQGLWKGQDSLHLHYGELAEVSSVRAYRFLSTTKIFLTNTYFISDNFRRDISNS